MRAFTKTTTSRLESYFFFPMFILAMLGMYRVIPKAINFAIDFPGTAPVMIFNFFFFGLAVLWVVIPLMGFRLNESLDIKRLIVFPITFPRLYFAFTLGNFIDISTIVPFTIVAALFKFQVVYGMDGGIFGMFLLCIVVFLFLQLFYQSAILVLYSLLPRFNPIKLIALVLAGCVAFVVMINTGRIQMPDELILLNDENLAFHNKLPTGIFAICAYEFYVGNISLGYEFLAKSALILVPIFLFNGVVTFLTYKGVELGLVRERIPKKKKIRKRVKSNRFIGKLLNNPVFVISIKDSRTYLRDWHFVFYKMMPGVITPVLVLLLIRYSVTGGHLSSNDQYVRTMEYVFLGVVFQLFLLQACIFVGNIFGYERAAISSLFLTPVSDRQILLGKNLFLLLLLTFDALVISCLTLLFFPHFQTALLIFCFMEAVVIILIGLGNLSSIIFPYFVPFDKPTVSFQGTLIVGLMNMATILLLVFLMSPVVAMLYHSLQSQNWVMLAVTIPASLIYSLMVYINLLKVAENMMSRSRESIYRNVSTP